MGYTNSTKTWGTDQLFWNALHLNGGSLVLNDGNTEPITMMVGGLNGSTPTALKINASGQLETSATISGDVNVDNTSLSTEGYIGKDGGTNADFAVAYTSGTTITLSSLPDDVTAFTADDIVSITQIATDGSVTETYTRDDAIMTMAGDVITVGGASFVATDTFVINTNVSKPSAGQSYDSGTGSDKVFEISPISTHYVTETLLDDEDIADDTYYYYIDMNGYRYFSLQGANLAGTMTITLEATNRDDGTAPASITEWEDVTDSLSGETDWTADFFCIVDTNVAFKYVRVKVVSAGGASGDDLTLFAKKMY